jgi:hypothetical protein
MAGCWIAGATGLAAMAGEANADAARITGAILPRRIETAPLVALQNKRES